MNTDELLADALKRCMRKAPLEKITVKDITDACGVSRQTFYRHFQDKQALVNWYFEVILEESFRHMGKGKTIYEALVNKFTYIQKEKLFFTAAFKNDEQNNLRDHDFELILAFYSNRIKENIGKELPETLQFQLEMYCQGSIYMTTKWLFQGAKLSPQSLAKQLTDAMPEEVKHIFTELNMIECDTSPSL